MILVLGVWTFLRALLGGATTVALEHVALRHQLMVLQRSAARPRLRRRDRILWVCLSWLWSNWRASLILVRPATVVAWHRQGALLGGDAGARVLPVRARSQGARPATSPAATWRRDRQTQGRASCREREEITVVARSLKKKTKGMM